MLGILRDHHATVGELADALPIARPGVSRHLRVLREAGLVSVEQEAQRRIWRPTGRSGATRWKYLGPRQGTGLASGRLHWMT